MYHYIVISCGNDGKVHLWSLAIGEVVQTSFLHSDYVKAIALSVPLSLSPSSSSIGMLMLYNLFLWVESAIGWRADHVHGRTRWQDVPMGCGAVARR